MELEMSLNFGQLLNWFSQLYPLIHGAKYYSPKVCAVGTKGVNSCCHHILLCDRGHCAVSSFDF